MMGTSIDVAPEMGASCGVRLKQAREQAGLSQEEVAASLKIPVRVLRQLESGDPDQLGAPVFVRGQMRSYARLLGIDLEDQLRNGVAAPVAPSELVSHTYTPRYRHVFDQVTRRAIYIVLTAAIAVPVWLATRSPHQSTVQSLEVPATPAGQGELPSTAPAPQGVQRTPLIASIAPLSAASAQTALSLKFNGDSWIQIIGNNGTTLEQGLLGAGQERSYGAGEVSRVVLGNSTAVEVRQAGKTVDLTPFSRANVARFTLSSDGSLTPVAD
ncbi:helix-turn-helix domain-containing protein [Lysobacter sp. TAF61]|uniref:helix-turn-helix domain-containing protein n=1 Tax=Lysobacter sp. TAF61 TaxID=3233072 RepID=UPI003F9C4F9E